MGIKLLNWKKNCQNLKQNFMIRSKGIYEVEQNFEIRKKSSKLGTKKISKTEKWKQNS